MSEENQNPPVEGEGQGQEQDPLHNFKSEVNRKIGNQESKLDQIAALTQQILESQQTQRQPSPPNEAEFDPFDENSLKSYLDKRDQAIQQKIDGAEQSRRREQARQLKIQEMAVEYPEIGVAGSALYNQVMSVYQAMPEGFRDTPEGVENIVYKAALQTGTLPKSARGQDNFSMGGSKGSPDPVKNEDKAQETAKTLLGLMAPELANSKEGEEALDKAMKRKSWSNYR